MKAIKLKHVFICSIQNSKQFKYLKDRFRVNIKILIQEQITSLENLIFRFLEVVDGHYAVLYIVTPKQKFIKDLISRLPNIVYTILVRNKVKLYKNLNVKYAKTFVTGKEPVFYSIDDVEFNSPLTLEDVKAWGKKLILSDTDINEE